MLCVQPRTSQAFTDLLLPSCLWLNTNSPLKKSVTIRIVWLFSWSKSCSLTELTRQITPPTKNGHAPTPIESRKGAQLVNPYYVRTWWVFSCWVKLSHRLHFGWWPSINSLFFFTSIPTWLVPVGWYNNYIVHFYDSSFFFLLVICLLFDSFSSHPRPVVRLFDALELRQAVVGKSAQTVPRMFAVIWSHPTRLEKRSSDSNMCARLRVIKSQVQSK